MDKDIELRNGLYINFQNKNIAHRLWVSDDGVKKLKPVDYRMEIQSFCDCDFRDLEDEIYNLLHLIDISKPDEDELRNAINRCYEIAEIIGQRNKTLGALLSGTFAEIVSDKEILNTYESSKSLETALTTLSIRLYELLVIQRKVRNFFPCIIHRELFEDYLSEIIPKAVFCKTVYTYIDGQEKSLLFFDYVKDYYEYLMLLFYNRKETVCECELCSRYFIPKTKKKTLYCDRVFKDGKTCKQIGPLLKHKKLEENDLVLQTFNKEKNKMYKRMERAYTFGETPKAISPDEYTAWLNRAVNAKNMYLNNELSEAQALEIIRTE